MHNRCYLEAAGRIAITFSLQFPQSMAISQGNEPSCEASCMCVCVRKWEWLHTLLFTSWNNCLKKAFTTVIVSFILVVPGLKLFVVWLWLLIKVQNNLANKWQCDRDHRQRGIMSKPSDHNLAHRKRKSWLLKELDFYLDTFVLATQSPWLHELLWIPIKKNILHRPSTPQSFTVTGCSTWIESL